MSQPDKALLVSPAWLDHLVAKEVSLLPKPIKTRAQGEVFLAEVGTGLVRATARLTDCRTLNESELATEPMQAVLLATGWPQVYGWFLINVETLAHPWTIPGEARKSCSHWVPRQRWDPESTAAQDERRKKVGKAWPKRFPRKDRSVLRQTMPRPRCIIPRMKGQKQKKPRSAQKKRSHANAPATLSACHAPRETAQLSLAQRIAAGRTGARLQHLAEMHLFHVPRQLHEPAQPKAGLFARHGDKAVYIVSVWIDTRRKRSMADVLPLLPHGDTTYTAFRTQIFTCEQRHLCNVGEHLLTLKRKNLSKGKLFFDLQDRPAPADSAPSPGAEYRFSEVVFSNIQLFCFSCLRNVKLWLRAGLAMEVSQATDDVVMAAPSGTARNYVLPDGAKAKTSDDDTKCDTDYAPWGEQDTSLGDLVKSAVYPSLASQHETFQCSAQGGRVVMRCRKTDACKFLLDLPVPRVFHTRPWRCFDCGAQFQVTLSDIKKTFPGVLTAKCRRQSRLFFSPRFLQLIIGKFGETFNAAAVKRFIMDLYLANTIYLNKAESAMWATHAVPRLASLRFVLREALLSYLPGLIQHIEEHVHTYSGSAVRGDGHYKIAARIRAGNPASPVNVIYAWIGVDGALLRPPAALQSETWPHLRANLEPLLLDMRRNRMRAGMSVQTACPAFHATDSFGKHRLKLRALYKSVAKPQLATVAVTPQGEAASAVGAMEESPTLSLGNANE